MKKKLILLLVIILTIFIMPNVLAGYSVVYNDSFNRVDTWPLTGDWRERVDVGASKWRIDQTLLFNDSAGGNHQAYLDWNLVSGNIENITRIDWDFAWDENKQAGNQQLMMQFVNGSGSLLTQCGSGSDPTNGWYFICRNSSSAWQYLGSTWTNNFTADNLESISLRNFNTSVGTMDIYYNDNLIVSSFELERKGSDLNNITFFGKGTASGGSFEAWVDNLILYETTEDPELTLTHDMVNNTEYGYDSISINFSGTVENTGTTFDCDFQVDSIVNDSMDDITITTTQRFNYTFPVNTSDYVTFEINCSNADIHETTGVYTYQVDLVDVVITLTESLNNTDFVFDHSNINETITTSVNFVNDNILWYNVSIKDSSNAVQENYFGNLTGLGITSISNITSRSASSLGKGNFSLWLTGADIINDFTEIHYFEILENPTQSLITDPNGNEVISKEFGFNITWSESTFQFDSAKVNYDLDYSSNSGGSWSDLATVSNTTTYNWNVSSLTQGTSYLVRVRAIAADYNDRNSTFDNSDTSFTITNIPDTPTVIYPNGGEDINGLTIVINVTWVNDTAIAPRNYTVSYSNDSGANYYEITTNSWTTFDVSNNSGQLLYYWNVSSLNTITINNYLINITVDDGISTVKSDISDATFTIWQGPLFGNLTVPSLSDVNDINSITADCDPFSTITSAYINVTNPASVKSTLTFVDIGNNQLALNYSPQNSGIYTFDGAICTDASGSTILTDSSTMTVQSSGGSSPSAPPDDPPPEEEPPGEIPPLLPLLGNLTGGGGGSLGYIEPVENADFDIVGVNFNNKATKQLAIKPGDTKESCLEIINKADVTQTITMSCELPDKPVRNDLCEWFTFDEKIVTIQPSDELRKKVCMEITTPNDITLNQGFVVMITGKSTLGSTAKHPITMIVSDPSQIVPLLLGRYFDDTLTQSTYELIRDNITENVRTLPFSWPNILFPVIILNHALLFLLIKLLFSRKGKPVNPITHIIIQILFFFVVTTLSIFFPAFMLAMFGLLGLFDIGVFVIKKVA